jgi:hypothetical protein
VHVFWLEEALPSAATGHHGISVLRLLGSDVSPIETFWVGISYFLAGGGAEHGATNLEKVYVVSLIETTREPN